MLDLLKKRLVGGAKGGFCGNGGNGVVVVNIAKNIKGFSSVDIRACLPCELVAVELNVLADLITLLNIGVDDIEGLSL